MSTYFFTLILEVSVKTSQKPKGNTLAMRCSCTWSILYLSS